MINVIISIITIFSLCTLVVLLNITTPVTAGPFGILAVFIFAYIFLVVLVAYFLQGVSRVISHLTVMFISKKPFETISPKRSYYYSTVIAAAPVMLVGLQSVGVVGIYEYILVSTFVIIGCFYISKR